MYLSNGNVKAAKYVLSVMEDGSIQLVWYMGTTKYVEKNPEIHKKYDGSMVIEYGTPNLLGTRMTLSFSDEKGNLSEKWTKIK